MSRYVLRFLLLLIICLTAPGCVCTWVTDLSKEPKAWGEYQQNKIYVLQKPAYLMNDKTSWYRKLYTDEEISKHSYAHAQVHGTLTPGTRMQAIKVIDTELVGIIIYNIPIRSVIMKILDGPFAGQKVAANHRPWESLDPQYLIPEK